MLRCKPSLVYLRHSILAVAAMICVVASTPSAMASSAAQFDDDGLLLKPDNWREWVFMGSTVTPDDMNYGAAYSPGMKYAYID